MLTRIITSIVAIAVFIAVIIFDPLILQFAMGIVVAFMLYECSHAMTKSIPVKVISYICGIAVLIGMMCGGSAAMLTICSTVALFMLMTVLQHGKTDHREVFSMGFMTLYISVFMSYIVKLRIDFGLCAMLVVFLSAWGSDTGAYFAGSFLGKHKLIPNVSPKKTVEGSIGGMISAMLCCQIMMFVAGIKGEVVVGLTGVSGYAIIGLIGILGSVLSQIGDLTASAIKRDCGVKDYGKIFPGHGGFMDRFDSVVMIAPVIYYIMEKLV